MAKSSIAFFLNRKVHIYEGKEAAVPPYQETEKEHAMAFELPDLPYAHDALAAGGMSQETLEFHHDLPTKPMSTTATSCLLVPAMRTSPSKRSSRPPITLMRWSSQGCSTMPQHWNHIQFWEMMGPGGRDMPSELESAIVDSFGSVDKFKEEFWAAGAGQFGSGWCRLVKDTDGGLKVTKTENGVNLLCFGQTALLGCDVWEPYYIDFRNKPAYLTNFSTIWSTGKTSPHACRRLRNTFEKGAVMPLLRNAPNPT